MLRALLLLLLALAAVLPPAGLVYAEDREPAAESDAQVRAALKQLASPVRATRRDGVERLLELLPGARPQIIAALESSSWSVQVQLLEILGQDGSEEAVAALLRHLARADETQAVRIRLSLVRDVTAAARLLASWRTDPEAFLAQGGAGKRSATRLGELVDLLRRAEIEAKFLSRKSKSGSTGYYKGQYDLLKGEGLEKDYRDLALEVVAGIALDRAIPTPGMYRTGIYRFLRPHFVDEWEFQSMALNAVAELITPEDKIIIERLEQRRLELYMKRERLRDAFLEVRSFNPDYNSKEYQDAWFDWDDSLGEYLDQVACLYLVLPDKYDRHVREFIDYLGGRNPRPVRPWGLIAGLQIRCGWYSEAIDSYRISMHQSSKAYGYYNQACAYASWSLKEGLSKRERERLLDKAMRCMTWSVEYGWSDVEWMNEDRDLDPLRKHRKREYDELVKVIKIKYELEDE